LRSDLNRIAGQEHDEENQFDFLHGRTRGELGELGTATITPEFETLSVAPTLL